jgi:hypothetical protein
MPDTTVWQIQSSAVLALLQPQGKGSYCPVQRNQQHVFIFCLKKKEINS